MNFILSHFHVLNSNSANYQMPTFSTASTVVNGSAENDHEVKDSIEATHPQSSGNQKLFVNPRDKNGRYHPLPTSAIHKVYMYKIAKDTTFNEIVHFLYGFNFYSLVYEPVYGYAVVGFHHGWEAEEAIDYINGRTLHGGQMQAYWHGFP